MLGIFIKEKKLCSKGKNNKCMEKKYPLVKILFKRIMYIEVEKEIFKDKEVQEILIFDQQ